MQEIKNLLINKKIIDVNFGCDEGQIIIEIEGGEKIAISAIGIDSFIDVGIVSNSQQENYKKREDPVVEIRYKRPE